MKQITLGMVWNRDWHHFEVTKIFKNGKVQITETWIAEDSGKDCKSVENYNVSEDEYGQQFAWQDKYKEYAFDEREEDGYHWWARMYAIGEDTDNGCTLEEVLMENGYTEEEAKAVAKNKEDKEMKGARVEVQQIEVNGVVYVTTRPGYYYKKQDGKQVRISKAEYEQAYDEYIANAEAEEPWDTEKEIEERKQVEEKKDVEAEHNFKKQVKRSKDIAHESNGVTLTAKQVKFIQRMPEDDFYEHGLDSALWVDVYCDTIADEFSPMAVGAMVSTLREKGLVSVTAERVNGRKAKYMTFTELGKKVAKDLGLK